MTNLHGVLSEAQDRFRELVSGSLRELLEEKHLYQTMTISAKPIVDAAKARCAAYGEAGATVEDQVCRYMLLPWELLPKLRSPLGHAFDPPSEQAVPLELPTLKLFCRRCKRKEAYNPFLLNDVYAQNILTYVRPDGRRDLQLLLLEYQCQSCKGSPEVFLVWRHELRIGLHGRSPMEVFPPPNVIPKNESKFFGDSIIAFNAGQPLAALFLLRTFIEQVTRRAVQPPENAMADQVLGEYAKQLPTDFKQRFPSLKQVYGKLSEAIHQAEAPAGLFEKCRDEVVEHFEARRLFKLEAK